MFFCTSFFEVELYSVVLMFDLALPLYGVFFFISLSVVNSVVAFDSDV